MGKSKKSFAPPRKSSRILDKNPIHSPTPIISDHSVSSPSPPSSPSSNFSMSFSLKRIEHDEICEDSKKKRKFDIESSLDNKADFWNSSHENLFQSLKSKTIVHGRIIDLNHLLTINCPIKEFFEFQGWANLFSTTPKVVYEPLVRLFFANLLSLKPGEVESLVLGKRIFVDCDTLDEILDIHCSGFSSPVKNSWPSDFDVSLDEAKRSLCLDPSPGSSSLGLKDLSFEARVLDHIVATTLLP